MKEVVAQLVTLVGGARSHKARAGEPRTDRDHLRPSIEHGLHGARKPEVEQPNLARSDEMYHRVPAHPETAGCAAARPWGKTIPLEVRDQLDEFNR